MIIGFLKVVTFVILVYLTLSVFRMLFAAWRLMRTARRDTKAAGGPRRPSTPGSRSVIELDKDDYRVE